jgi:hypothetical protein
VKKGHQQGGGQANQLPSPEKRFNRPGQRREDHAQQKNGKQSEEAVVARFTVKVSAAERPDHAAQSEGKHYKWDRQPVEHEFDRESEMVDHHPPADGQRNMPFSGDQHERQHSCRGAQSH